MMTRTSTQAID